MKMKKTVIAGGAAYAAAAFSLTGFASPWGQRPDARHAYAVHDDRCPAPAKVTVPAATGVPSDAIVLWDGSAECLQRNWCDEKGGPTKWTRAENGDFISVAGAGYVCTRESFADVQLHVEFATDRDPEHARSGAGNSGVFLPGGYEVQVLDSLEEPERVRGLVRANYADGSCGAIYGQKPPDVNPCRGQTEWQTYDIIFHPARVKDGKVVRNATVTVLFNGVLVQDHWSCEAPTDWLVRNTPLKVTEGPIKLQDHGHPVHYRNIWVRRIRPREANVLFGEFADEQAIAAKRKELADEADREYEKWEKEMPLDEKLCRAWTPAAYWPTPERLARARAVEQAFLAENAGKPLAHYKYGCFYPSLLDLGLIDSRNEALKLVTERHPALWKNEVEQVSDNAVMFHTGYEYCVPSFTYTGPAARLEMMPTQNTNKWWGSVTYMCDGKGPVHRFTSLRVLRDNYLKFFAYDKDGKPVPLKPEDIVLEREAPTFMRKLSDETWQQKLDRIAWWQDDRFGMFIHFGLYALPARHEWYMSTSKVSYADYDRYFRDFNPDRFDAREWARTAKRAGMKYVVLTTKHHDGFCLFDSKYTDWKITKTPFGRDLVREYVDALRAEGLKVGFYYSVRDWHHPDAPIDKTHPLRPADIGKGRTPEYFAKLNAGRDIAVYYDYLRNQVKELLTEYGKIDIIWFDGSPRSVVFGENGRRYDWDFDYKAVYAWTRSLQPDIIINDRLTLNDFEDGQDFLSPEQCRNEEPLTYAGKEWPWETCQTFSGSWGYYRDEKTWKSGFQIIEQLVKVVSCGGNLIMNVGPTGRGEFDGRARERLDDYAKWMAANGESIYGCGAAPKDIPRIPNTLYTYNAKTRKLYVHFTCWPTGPVLLPFANRVKYAQFLHDKSELIVGLDEVTGSKGVLNIPLDKPPVEIPVVELTLK